MVMEQREGTRKRCREGECGYWAKGGDMRGGQGSGNMVMEHREGGREGNKAVGLRLWTIGKGIERGTRPC